MLSFMCEKKRILVHCLFTVCLYHTVEIYYENINLEKLFNNKVCLKPLIVPKSSNRVIIQYFNIHFFFVNTYNTAFCSNVTLKSNSSKL